MSPRAGRPKSNNAMTVRITVRLNNELVQILQKYCKQENIEESEAVRRALKKLSLDIKE